MLLSSRGGWVDATPKRLPDSIDSVYFLDRRHGWLISTNCAGRGGPMYRTADSGKTWTRVSNGWYHNCSAGSGFTIHFLDPQRGWILTNEPNGPVSALQRTLDGGRTWRVISPTRQLLSDFVFGSPETGWATNWPFAFLDSHPAPLIRTVDSGRTWHPQESLPRRRFYSLPVFFGRSGAVAAARSNTISFYVSADAGNRWEVRSVASVRGRVSNLALRASSKRAWWISGLAAGHRFLLFSGNHGRTWHHNELRLPGANRYVELSPVSDRSAWVATASNSGATHLFATGDGGRTWRRLDPPL